MSSLSARTKVCAATVINNFIWWINSLYSTLHLWCTCSTSTRGFNTVYILSSITHDGWSELIARLMCTIGYRYAFDSSYYQISITNWQLNRNTTMPAITPKYCTEPKLRRRPRCWSGLPFVNIEGLWCDTTYKLETGTIWVAVIREYCYSSKLYLDQK